MRAALAILTLAILLSLAGFGLAAPVPGEQWNRIDDRRYDQLRDLVWNGSLWVVVGADGVVKTSPDGSSWTVHDSTVLTDLNGVAWNGSKFVAVGKGGKVIQSINGSDWTLNSVLSQSLTDITWTGSLFAAVGEQKTIYTSPNGANWTERFQSSGTWNCVAGSGNTIVAAGTGIVRSLDGGETWQPGSAAGGTFRAIIWTGNKFVAVGNNSAAATSSDGLVWTDNHFPGVTAVFSDFWSLSMAGATLVAVGEGIFRSTNQGATWENQNVARRIFAVSGSDGSRFLAMENCDSVATSPNGRSWEMHFENGSPPLEKLIWTGSRYVGVGMLGIIVTSEDRESWTYRGAGLATHLNDVASNGNLLVAVGDNGIIRTSSDGTNWVTRRAPVSASGPLLSVVWTGSRWITIGGKILISSDGVSWTELAHPGSAIYAIDASGPRVVAVGRDGSVLTSENLAATWTTQTAPTNGGSLMSISWSGSSYLAGGPQGLVYSTDGLQWSAVESGPQNISDVAWNGTQFVALSGSAFVYVLEEDFTSARHATDGANLAGLLFDGSEMVGYGSDIASSPDGTSWTKESGDLIDPPEFRHVSGVGDTVVAFPETGQVSVKRPGSPWIEVDLGGANLAIRDVASNGSTMVAVGSSFLGAQFAHIVRSTDGVNWTHFETGIRGECSAVVWAGNHFVVGSTGGTVWTSVDGLQWQATETGVYIAVLAWNGKTLFSGGHSSPDGINWINQSPQVLRDVEWMNDRWVAAGHSSVYHSFDGVQWTRQNLPVDATIWGMTWTGSQIVAVGLNGVVTSPDATEWTDRSMNFGRLTGVANNGTLIVAVGVTSALITSLDGVTWSRTFDVALQGTLDLIWNGTLFCAVGTSQIDRRFGQIATSLDGQNWELNSNLPPLETAIWDGSRFVAVGPGGLVGTFEPATGENPAQWTSVRSGSERLGGVAWNGSLYVITGKGGEILTSPDLQTWTPRVNSSGSDRLDHVAWNGSQFVVVSRPDLIMTSDDGINWTTRKGLDGLSGWGNDLVGITNAFLTVGDSGHVQRSLGGVESWQQLELATWKDFQAATEANAGIVAVGEAGLVGTSPDGRVWTEQAEPTSVRLWDVEVVGGQVIAVGENGVILQTCAGDRAPTGFDQWVMDQQLSPGEDEASDDPNQDGARNLIAYALNIPALGPVSAEWQERQPRFANSNGLSTLKFILPATLPSDLFYSIDRSTSLQEGSWELLGWRTRDLPWTDSTIAEETLPDGTRQITVQLPSETVSAEYYRLRIDQQ